MLVMGLFLRYPSEGVEIGSPDSWDYHMQINQIRKENHITWLFNPLSYFGLYPPYYEVGTVLLVASLCEVLEIESTHAILLMATLFGVMSGFFIYLVANEFANNRIIALIASIVYSCSPVMYKSTLWGIQQRAAVAIFLLIPIFYLMRTYNGNLFNNRFLLLFILSVISFSSIHKSSIFIFVILLCYIFAIIINFARHKLHTFFSFPKRKMIYLMVLITIIIIINLLIIVGAYLGKPMDESLPSAIYNRGFQISIDIGFPIIFIGGGFFTLYKKFRVNYQMIFFLLLLVVTIYINFFIPPQRTIREPISYFTLYLVYFIFISFGIYSFTLIIKNKKNFIIIAISILIITSFLPEYIQVHEADKNRKNIIPKDYVVKNSMEIGTYLKFGTQKNENDQIITFQTKYHIICSFSDIKFFHPQEIIFIQNTKRDWDWDFFFDSGKAEGFVREDVRQKSQIPRELYFYSPLNGESFQYEARTYDIKFCLIESYIYPESIGNKYPLISDLFNDRYIIYYNSFMKIFILNENF